MGLRFLPRLYQFHQLVLPLHRGAGDRQQLRQPFHLRRQVPRVPDGRQTPDVETNNEPAAVASPRYRSFLNEIRRYRHQTTTYIHSETLSIMIM